RFGLREVATPDEHARHFPFGDTARPFRAAGARSVIEAPESDPKVAVSRRLPPAVFGRGYLDAIEPQEVERMGALAEARQGPVRGRVARVRSVRTGELSVGRFGLKARAVDLEEFTAQAFHGD